LSVILRLYPPAWRERYGDELAELLAARPVTIGDRLDLLWGAMDARLHPQTPGVIAAQEQESPMRSRALGLLAAIGGVSWILAIASLFVLTPPGGDREEAIAAVGLGAGMALMAVALAQLGTRNGSTMSVVTSRILALVGVALASTMIMPWPLMMIAALGFPLFAIVGAVRGAVNGRLPIWFVGLSLATLAGVLGAAGLIGEAGPWALTLVGVTALVLAALAFRSDRDGDVTRMRTA
jgi:hypothetical protein